MVSTSTAICMAPRAETENTPALSVSSTWMEIFVRISRIRRSRITREVTFLPSRPPKGPLLMENSMEIVGGSIATNGRASVSGEPPRVSPMFTFSNPATPTILPATPTAESVVPSPEYSNMRVTLPETQVPPLWWSQTVSPFFTEPEVIRPMATRPT